MPYVNRGIPRPNDAADERTYTVVTAHFGDKFWIDHALRQLDRFSDERLRKVVVINQDREPFSYLWSLPRVQQILTFPPNVCQIKILGHDHPAALDRALQTIEFDTSHVLIMDSDCFPIANGWMDSLEDVTLAGDPRNLGLTHPCMMSIPISVLQHIHFSEGVENGFDTGRLVGKQLSEAGHLVSIDRPGRSFNGFFGWTYLDGKVYHHGSGSFLSASDKRLSRQSYAILEARLRSKVRRNQFALNPFQIIEIGLLKTLGRVRRFLS